MESLTGKVIKLNEDQAKVMSSILSERRKVTVLIHEAASMAEAHSRDMWKTVRQMLPELDDYHLTINWIEMEIRINSTMTPQEKAVSLKEDEE